MIGKYQVRKIAAYVLVDKYLMCLFWYSTQTLLPGLGLAVICFLFCFSAKLS